MKPIQPKAKWRCPARQSQRIHMDSSSKNRSQLRETRKNASDRENLGHRTEERPSGHPDRHNPTCHSIEKPCHCARQQTVALSGRRIKPNRDRNAPVMQRARHAARWDSVFNPQSTRGLEDHESVNQGHCFAPFNETAIAWFPGTVATDLPEVGLCRRPLSVRHRSEIAGPVHLPRFSLPRVLEH